MLVYLGYNCKQQSAVGLVMHVTPSPTDTIQNLKYNSCISVKITLYTATANHMTTRHGVHHRQPHLFVCRQHPCRAVPSALEFCGLSWMAGLWLPMLSVYKFSFCLFEKGVLWLLGDSSKLFEKSFLSCRRQQHTETWSTFLCHGRREFRDRHLDLRMEFLLQLACNVYCHHITTWKWWVSNVMWSHSLTFSLS